MINGIEASDKDEGDRHPLVLVTGGTGLWCYSPTTATLGASSVVLIRLQLRRACRSRN